MKINEKLTKQITEIKYLSVENSWRYRVIVRYFYEQFENINYILYKEDVYEELITHDMFSEYTIDQCAIDLDTLVTWGNLIAIQDTSKVQTVEEFKNKKYRYEISQYSIEIERLTLKLENLKISGASLEPSLIERIKNSLNCFKENIIKDKKITYEWWSDLISDFERLNVNYQDYIKQIYSLKPEEMMNTNAFLIFKEKLIEYLRDFIKALQHNIFEIEEILKNISCSDEELMYSNVVSYSMEIPRVDPVTYEEIMDSIISKWRNIKKWFIGYKSKESEAEKLFDVTSEIIRRLTRYAAQLSESMVSSINRKEDYKKLGEIFLNCTNIEDAHKLSAYVFGLEHMRHIHGDFERNTDSVNSEVYEEDPFEIIIKPRIRTYKEKVNKYAIKDKSKEKEELINKILLERKKQEKLLDKYIVDGEIHFDKLDCINAFVRNTLLGWLSSSMISDNFSFKNENGKTIKIDNPYEQKKCVVHCNDGDFEMPSFILKVE